MRTEPKTREVPVDATVRLAAPGSPRSAPVQELAGEARPPKILVVDDQMQVREVTVAVLRQAGYRVVEAETATAALEVSAAPGFDVDLLISDVIMPVMNGVQLAGAIRARHPGLKVILTSGYSEDTVEQMTPGARAYELLRKPYRLEELLRRVRAALNRTGPQSAGPCRGAPR